MTRGKVLMVAATASMIKQFNVRNIEILQSLGYEVTVVANFEQPGTITKEISDQFRQYLINKNVDVVQLDFERGMGHFSSNIRIINKLRKIIAKGIFNFIHTQGALSSVLCRLAAYGLHTRVLYTAHGFQFSKNSSFLRNVIFGTIEYLLSYITWGIVTINNDDTHVAKKYFKTKRVYNIDGVGIDLKKFSKTTEKPLFGDGKITMITVGELSKRKNQKIVIQAMAKLNVPELHYVLVGIGDEYDFLVSMVNNLKLQDKVHFFKYSEEVNKLYNASDFGIYTSYLEGLLTAGVESLAIGLPIIGSNVRGISDLISNGYNGILINPDDVNSVVESIKKMINLTDDERNRMSNISLEMAQRFDSSIIDNKMKQIYLEIGEKDG